MKTIQEKSQQCRSYIENEVGLDSWLLLKMYETNSWDILNSISLNLHLVQSEDFIKNANLFPVKSPESDLIRIRQHLLLDVIMKIEILIETFLVLLYSLDGNYKGLPANLVRYPQRLVYSTINRIRSRDFPPPNFIYFGISPRLKCCQYTDKEKEFLFTRYQSIDNFYYEIANRICNFYENFLIIYFKSKHGLIIIPEIVAPGTETTFKNSSLVCLDNTNKKYLKGEYFESPLNSDNFNTLAYLNFNDRLLKEIEGIIYDLKKIISDACILIKKRIINCGESYFPINKIDATWFWPEKLSESDKATFDIIANKIRPWYYEPKQESMSATFKVYNDDIVQSLRTNAVTIVHNP